jgi:hypothetical protein
MAVNSILESRVIGGVVKTQETMSERSESNDDPIRNSSLPTGREPYFILNKSELSGDPSRN